MNTVLSTEIGLREKRLLGKHAVLQEWRIVDVLGTCDTAKHWAVLSVWTLGKGQLASESSTANWV